MPEVNHRACRECGCTDECPCLVAGVPCSWAERDLCSACAAHPKAAMEALGGEELMEMAARDIRAFGGVPLAMTMGVGEWWVVFSHLQLALRHPGANRFGSAIARDIAQDLGAMIARSPALREMVRRGWEAEHDEPREPDPEPLIVAPGGFVV